MKTRIFLWGLLASAMLVGCSQNDDAPGAEGGKDASAYMAVNIRFVQDGMSRAGQAGNFEEGSAIENIVNKAFFFFFDDEGNAFDVSQRSPNGASSQTMTNCVTAIYPTTGTDSGDDTGKGGNNNIERKLAALVVIHTKDGVYPTKMVTALNLNNTFEGQYLSLNELNGKFETYLNSNDDSFLMSSSVYLANDGSKVQMTDILEDKLFEDEGGALGHPIDVYVERLAAKTSVEVSSDNVDIYKTWDPGNIKGFKIMKDATNPMQIAIDGGTPSDVYAQILGWELNTTAKESYLFKNIEGLDLAANKPFDSWNDFNNKRSYWAISKTGVAYTTNFVWDDIPSLDSHDYCNENTTGEKNTKVLIKAKLVDESGNALDLYKWNGNYYTEDGLKNAVVSMLGSVLYKDNSSNQIDATYISWELGQVRYARLNASQPIPSTEYYKVYLKLTDGKEVYNSLGTKLNQEEVAAQFAQFGHVLAWKDGMAYYYTDIDHFGDKTGVVRNHHYKVKITGVQGLGTPVPDSDEDIPEVVKPEDSQHYIAAQINILSWKVVENNNVILK